LPIFIPFSKFKILLKAGNKLHLRTCAFLCIFLAYATFRHFWPKMGHLHPISDLLRSFFLKTVMLWWRKDKMSKNVIGLNYFSASFLFYSFFSWDVVQA
jgi:hypothetical protein